MKDKVGIIAVGQCGGNIGVELEQLGFNVLYINSSKGDLATLKGVLHPFHLKGGEGTAKDRTKAKKLLMNNKDEVMSAIKVQFEEQEHLFLAFSTSGGTGSGISPMLANAIIKELHKEVGVIAVIPSITECIQPLMNTYDCFAELESINKLGASLILDNNKNDKFDINKIFAELFKSFLEIPQNYNNKGNVDESEISRMLSSKGHMVIGKSETNNSKDVFSDVQNNIFADVESKKIRYGIVMSKEDIEQELIKEFGGITDIVKNCNEEDGILMALSGLSYPYVTINDIEREIESRREEVANNLKSEKRLEKKVFINLYGDDEDDETDDEDIFGMNF